MRKSLLLISLAVAAAAAVPPSTSSAQTAPAAPSSPTALQIAARVQALYNQTKTYQAAFKQEYTIKMHQQKRTSTGQVAFQKPGKMSFRYDQPNGNRVVSDGKVLKVYEQENSQMFSQKVDQSYYPAALSFLMGEGKLTESFDFSLVPPSQLVFEGGYVLDGKPKEATPAYQRVLIWVDAMTSQVRRVTVIDAQGNTNSFTFTDPRVNLRVPPDEFKFEPPEGTTTISP